MNKEEFLSTQFSEKDVDDFSMEGMKGSEGAGDAAVAAAAAKESEGQSQEDIETQAALAEEAEKAGVTIEELTEQKNETAKADEQKALEEEAESVGISVDDLKKVKKAETVKAEEAEEEKILQEEADKEGITLDQLKEQKKKEEEEAEEVALKEESAKTGKSIDQLKKEKVEAEEAGEFDLFEDIESTGTGDEQTANIDFNVAAKNVGIELEEGETLDSQEAFESKVKNTIENASQKLNLDDYPPEVKMILENLKENNNLFITDWYRNKTVRDTDAFLSRTDEAKIKSVLANEMKSQYSADDLKEVVDDAYDDMTENEIKEKAKSINKDVVKIRNKEINRFLGEKNEWLKKRETQDNQRVDVERGELVKKIETMEKFLGFKIPPEAKKIFVKDIKSGAFQKHLDANVVDTKVLAYLASRLGGKLEKGLENLIARERNSAYQKGTDTITKHKHNIRKETKSSGRPTKVGSQNGLVFKDDLFEE